MDVAVTNLRANLSEYLLRSRRGQEVRPTGSIRVLFMFDPQSNAVLLLGGDKRGDWTGWYEVNIPKADRLYDNYLNETKE